MNRVIAANFASICLIASATAYAGRPYLRLADAVKIRQISVEVVEATPMVTTHDVATGKVSAAFEGAGRTSQLLGSCGALGQAGILCLGLLPFTLIGGAIHGADRSSDAATTRKQLEAFSARLQKLHLMPLLRDHLIEEGERYGAADLLSKRPASTTSAVLEIALQGMVLDGEELGQQSFRVYPSVLASLTLAGNKRPVLQHKYTGHWKYAPFLTIPFRASAHKLENWVAMSDADFSDEMSRVIGDYANAIVSDFLSPWSEALTVGAPTSRPNKGWWDKPVESPSQPELIWHADLLAAAWAPVEYDIRIIETDYQLWRNIYIVPRYQLARQFLAAPAAYERAAVKSDRHLVESPLPPCKTYVWAVRARTGDRVTGWQFLGGKNTRVTAFRTVCPISNRVQ
jgi:hypothetical protein